MLSVRPGSQTTPSDPPLANICQPSEVSKQGHTHWNVEAQRGIWILEVSGEGVRPICQLIESDKSFYVGIQIKVIEHTLGQAKIQMHSFPLKLNPGFSRSSLCVCPSDEINANISWKVLWNRFALTALLELQLTTQVFLRFHYSVEPFWGSLKSGTMRKENTFLCIVLRTVCHSYYAQCNYFWVCSNVISESIPTMPTTVIFAVMRSNYFRVAAMSFLKLRAFKGPLPPPLL